ncbi:MAG: discoidin domain-containing protein [Fimbriimonadaceae bacterium]|nr:discoidin domain-containing protein [Fimbriimonadaceae bacterium]
MRLPTWLLLALTTAAAAAPPTFREQVEADWLTQDRLRFVGGAARTTAEDATGAVDGIKNGEWGFHTNLEESPWWQVDLTRATALSHALVYNRLGTSDRTRAFRALLSDDGQVWREVYRHTDRLFGGINGQPLRIDLAGQTGRYLRLQVLTRTWFNLDEAEVYGAADPAANLALGQPADQSSLSPWSVQHRPARHAGDPIDEALARGRRLAADLRAAGVDTAAAEAALDAAAGRVQRDWTALDAAARRALYFAVRWTNRELALRNPLLNFDQLVFAKRAPGSFSHQSDQHYGWWSRPGGGLYLLSGLHSGEPTVRCLTPDLPPGSVMAPELSPDGQRIVFAWCRYYPDLAARRDKVNTEQLPEDGFYHLFEIHTDGSGLRQLTRGRYDDFDPRYLPSGRIVFLSTRRGQFTQCVPTAAQATLTATLPDSYVRCGGDPYRPVAVYTLHTIAADGSELTPISPFESFEWTPSVAADGRVLYARWDYVDRDNMPYMGLWSANPDGSQVQAVYGNYTRGLHGVFEARSIPNSRRLVFTATAHHSITGGSLVLLDPARGLDGPEPLTKLTPEVVYPEVEGWPQAYYANPWPLSETYYLVSWSNQPLNGQGGANPVNACGLYLYDAFGNLELLHRDPDISSHWPQPLAPRVTPPDLTGHVNWAAEPTGQFLLLNAYEGLGDVAPGSIKRLRLVATPIKTQPNMNTPNLGATADDPGKLVLGTVPVEPDGSAWFRVPAGVGVFLQALDAEGQAVRTMRTLTSVMPGQTQSCVGCHEPRQTSPGNRRPLAVRRAPSAITPGPAGSWPLRFDRLVQPLLDARCVTCHQPGAAAPQVNLTAAAAYDALSTSGNPSLRSQVQARYRAGRSLPGDGECRTSALGRLLLAPTGHAGVILTPPEREALITWIDTYGQRAGHYSPTEERELEGLRERWAGLLAR